MSQISFNAQIARGPHPMQIRASGSADLVQALGFNRSFATLNLQTNAQLTVTAVILHPVARRVQTLATRDLFL